MKRKILIVIAICMAVFFAACGDKDTPSTEPSADVSASVEPSTAPSPSEEPSVEPSAEPSNGLIADAPRIRVESVSYLADIDTAARLDLVYPRVVCEDTGLSYDCKEICEWVMQDIADGLLEGSECWAETSFETTYLSDNAASVVMTLEEYSGGSHPSTKRFCLTFTAESEYPIVVADLFDIGKLEEYPGDKKAFWDSIVKDVAAQATERDELYIDGDMEELIRQNFDTAKFALAPGGVNAYFVEYEIGPYAAGPQTFFVSKDKLVGTPVEWLFND